MFSNYPAISHDYEFETIVGAMIVRESISSPNEANRKVCKDMLNYISSNNLKTKNDRVIFEYVCLVITLALTKKNMFKDEDKDELLSMFSQVMRTYNLKSIFDKFIKYELEETSEQDPRSYSEVRLSSDNKNVLSLYTLTSDGKSLLFNWLEPTDICITFTKIYENLYNILFTNNRKKSTPIEILELLIKHDYTIRIKHNCTPPLPKTIYNRFFDSTKDAYYELAYCSKQHLFNSSTFLYDKLKHLPITVNFNLRYHQTDVTLNKINYELVTIKHVEPKIVRKLLTYHVSGLKIIEVEYREGSLGFLTNERLSTC